jgi:hypothetical protein
VLIIRSLMRYFGRVVDGRLSPFPLGGSRRDESGAQDAEKCLHLLTPHFAYGHEMSFRIKCLCAVKVTANRQKKSANDSIPPPVNNFFRDAKISSGT